MADRDILKELEKADSVPTLPTVVSSVLALIDDESVTTRDVADLIAEDPAITGQVLRAANSVVYNAMGMSTTSIGEAVGRLGLREVRNLVISLGVVQAFRETGTCFNATMFWRHCFTTALAAGLVAARSNLALPGGARDNPYFLAGLLHDIGVLLLSESLADDYFHLVERSVAESRPLHQLELEVLGADHQDLGAMLLRRWGLPFEVAAAAQHHHRADAAPPESRDYVQVVHLADWLALDQGYGSPVGEALVALHTPALEDLGIDPGELEDLRGEVDAAARASSQLLSAVL